MPVWMQDSYWRPVVMAARGSAGTGGSSLCLNLHGSDPTCSGPRLIPCHKCFASHARLRLNRQEGVKLSILW